MAAVVQRAAAVEWKVTLFGHSAHYCGYFHSTAATYHSTAATQCWCSDNALQQNILMGHRKIIYEVGMSLAFDFAIRDCHK